MTGPAAGEILVAAGARVVVAPLATTAPSDPVTPWAAAWIDLGHVSDAGLKFHDAKTLLEIKSWLNFRAVARRITAYDTLISLGLLQWNKNTVPLALGGGAITTAVTGGTATISNKALATNVATLTTSSPHGFLVGQYVVVVSNDPVFNGSFTITAVTSTTFSYALTHADVTSAVATGTATVGAAYRYAPPAAGTVDERSMGFDWVDGARHYRLIVGRGLADQAVDTDLTRSKESELPIGFHVTAGDTGDPYYFYTDDPAYA